MKVLAVNGSPRKKWNTATLLEKALEGAASEGAETELIHLYDLDYKGCRSCFVCKQKDGKSYGACAVKDGLAPVLDAIRDVDALILGSPIYFGRVTGEMRSFLERLMFPYLEYGDPWRTLFSRTMATGFIYTMNITEEEMTEMRLRYALESTEMTLAMIFGASEAQYCYDTLQFEDHDKVVCDRVDVDAKMRRRRDVFPVDCEKAFALGCRMTRDVTRG